MHVELVTHNPPGSVSGIGRYTRELHRHLSSVIDVRLLQPKDPPLTRYLPVLHHLPVGIDGHREGSIAHFTQIMGCAQMLWKPVHPAVATVHDLGMLEFPEERKMLDPIARRLLNLSLAGLRRMDLLLTVSNYTRETIIKHLRIPSQRVVTVHSGITDAFKPHANARAALCARYPQLNAHAGPWILYVGSELPRKNLLTLLRAVQLLRARRPDVLLVKVGAPGGDSFRADTLSHIEALQLAKNVLFFDQVSDQELALFYSAADLFATCSKLEGFGFPVLEAMACGLPVVCSDAAALPEIAGGAAILVDPLCHEDVAQALNALLDNEELHCHKSKEGLERASRFTWERTAAGVLDTYQSIMNGTNLSR